MQKNRPKYIEKQLKSINDIFRERKLKWEDHYDDTLFQWFTSYLVRHDWYRGFNVHYDAYDKNGNLFRALAGPNYDEHDYYIQIW